MTQILDKYSLKNSNCKVVETNDGVILNAHYYDKSTMTPQPLTTIPLEGTALDLCLSKRIVKSHVNGSYGTVETYGKESLTVVDSYDDTITYVFAENNRTTSINPSITKISEKNGVAAIENTVNMSAGYFVNGMCWRVYDVLGQSKDNLYVLGSTVYTSNGSSYYGWYTGVLTINKTTLAMTVTETFSRYFNASKICETPLYTYILVQGSKNAHTMKRLNKSTAKVETCTVTSNAGTSAAYTISQGSKGIEIEDGKFLSYSVREISGNLAFIHRVIDTNDDALDTCCKYVEDVTTVNAENGLDVDADAIPMANNYRLRWQLEVNEANGNHYLNVLFYDVSESISTYNGKYGIYTYRINKDTYELTLTGKTVIPGVIPFGMIANNKHNGLMAVTANSLRYYEFNVAKECWEETYLANDAIYSAGFDLSDNIWYATTAGVVEMITPESPVDISLAMEEAGYQYDGNDIDTNLVISAKDMNGDKVAAKIKLVIKGSAVFTSSGTKTTTTTTLVGQDLKLPITIKDGGQVIVYPELII